MTRHRVPAPFICGAFVMMIWLAMARPAWAQHYTVYYQDATIAHTIFGNPTTGLPNDAQHIHVFTQSTPSGGSSSAAQTIHALGSSFKYAPCFDVGKYPGWTSMTESQLASIARAYRDQCISWGADYFGFNEAPTTTCSSSNVRDKISILLRYLNEPNSQGKRLYGVFYFTEKNCNSANWTDPAPDFWTTLNQTCALVVAEHYHSTAFLMNNSLSYLKSHYSNFYQWLTTSTETDKQEIGRSKLVVLHSSFFGPGITGWAGGCSDTETLHAFRKALAKGAWLSRNCSGPYNIGWGPLYDQNIAPAVCTRIAELVRWHYAQNDAPEEMLPYEKLDGVPGHR